MTRILEALGRGERQATGELLPLVYHELRRLAARQLARESPGQTLQATALVHEAYLRLVGGDRDRIWTGRAHFLAADPTSRCRQWTGQWVPIRAFPAKPYDRCRDTQPIVPSAM